MATETFDLVVLGSGSTAFAAALRARELGKTAVMIEERTIGGTCVNRGCLPSKNLIEAAKLVHDARHPRYPGLAPVRMEVDFAALVHQKDELIADYRKQHYDGLVGDTITVRSGHARFLDPHTIDIAGSHLTGSTVLIATGSRPSLPSIEGLDRVPFLTSDLLSRDEPSALTSLPSSLLLIGGGYIALELGQMFARFGTRVTVLERGPRLLGAGYEPEVGAAIEGILRNEGIRIETQAQVRAVAHDGLEIVATVRIGEREQQIRAQQLLVATGRRPNTDSIAIETTGVKLGTHGEILVDRSLRTNVPHIFAAGDVIGTQHGSQMATPVGSQDGGIVADHAFSAGTPRQIDHRVVPRTIFIDPPLATVGLTEQQAITAGHSCWCRTIPMSLVPRAGAIRDTRGFVKMVADAATDEVLGVTMLGVNASEVIHEAAMALRFRATLHDFIDQLHVYPTMAESLKIAAISRYKDPAKLSCCAQ